MKNYKVAITPYRKKIKSVRKLIDLSELFNDLTGSESVFLKPNIVYWFINPYYQKFGVVTTSRVIEDTIIALNEQGIKNITIGEGIVVADPKDFETTRHAFEYLGYKKFEKKYGIKTINIFERPFEKVSVGDGIELNFNSDSLNSDLIISLPVLKTHAQTIVSLGLKNLKGLIDIGSRKKCHAADMQKDLDYYVSKLSNNLPPVITIIDGIFANERGPGYDGTMRRKNILLASKDVFSADKVGAKILGYEPSDIPYLVYYAKDHNRTLDLSDVEIVGTNFENFVEDFEYKFEYTENGINPMVFQKRGIKGISFREYDNSLCTYCSSMSTPLITAITFAWKGEPWDDIEILSGKRMEPTPEKKKTILFGQCMVNKHRNNPIINEMIPIKGCPAKPKDIINAFKTAGIDINPEFIENFNKFPALIGQKYRHRFNEFEECFFNEDFKTETTPPLEKIMVCQTYFDSIQHSNKNPYKQAKFEVYFLGLFGETYLKLIKNIIVEGPSNYEFKIKNKPFDFNNGNGYVIDKSSYDEVRFIGLDRDGFLEEGEYKISIEYSNNKCKSMSKTLHNNDKLLKTYLENRNQIEFTNKGNISSKDKDITKPFYTEWTTLKELANFDAYYVNRVSEGFSDFINLLDLYFYDNIFLLSLVMPSYGLNKKSAWINNSRRKLKSEYDYTWVTEICDSNKFENLNLSIYQPHQHFKI